MYASGSIRWLGVRDGAKRRRRREYAALHRSTEAAADPASGCAAPPAPHLRAHRHAEPFTVKYALLNAGNALGSLQLFAGRVAGSIGAVEPGLIVAEAWLAWRVLDRLIGPRRG